VPPIGPGACHRGGPAGCQVTAPGRAKPTAGEGAAWPGNQVDGQRNRSRPAVRGRAFSYPWPCELPGIPGVHGRMTDGVSPFAASRRVCAGRRGVARVGRGRSVKPSAQPTLVRTQHLPPPAKTARLLRILALAGRFYSVPVCVTLERCRSSYCAVHGRIADGRPGCKDGRCANLRRSVCTVAAVGVHRRRFHGRPRTAALAAFSGGGERRSRRASRLAD
jgi:hypothetical protein